MVVAGLRVSTGGGRSGNEVSSVVERIGKKLEVEGCVVVSFSVVGKSVGYGSLVSSNMRSLVIKILPLGLRHL